MYIFNDTRLDSGMKNNKCLFSTKFVDVFDGFIEFLLFRRLSSSSQVSFPVRFELSHERWWRRQLPAPYFFRSMFRLYTMPHYLSTKENGKEREKTFKSWYHALPFYFNIMLSGTLCINRSMRWYFCVLFCQQLLKTNVNWQNE